jgi:integrase
VAPTITVRRKGGRIKTLPITPAMETVLRECWDQHPVWVFTYKAARTRDGRVKGDRHPITCSGWKTYWRRRRAEAVASGCTSLVSTDGKTSLRIHDLRHTFGTNMQMATGDVRLVQRGLGHSKVETTEKYTHVFDDKLHQGMTTAENNHYLPGLASKRKQVG